MSTLVVTIGRREPRSMRKLLAHVLVPLYLAAIYGIPLTPIAFALGYFGYINPFLATAGLFATPLLFVLVAGGLARIHVAEVVEGRFPVDIAFKPYFHRRMYGLCWTSLYYSGPLYFLILSIPLLKAVTFRLFGYRGSMDFTVYPDTWIRDLPLLDFRAGCYLSNKATIGTNMIFFRNGKKMIEVGRISIGERSLIGHLTAIGPGTRIGNDVQVGVCCGIGRRTQFGDGAIVSDAVTIDHGAQIDCSALIPTRAYIASGVRITAKENLTRGQVVLRNGRESSRLNSREAEISLESR